MKRDRRAAAEAELAAAGLLVGATCNGGRCPNPIAKPKTMAALKAERARLGMAPPTRPSVAGLCAYHQGEAEFGRAKRGWAGTPFVEHVAKKPVEAPESAPQPPAVRPPRGAAALSTMRSLTVKKQMRVADVKIDPKRKPDPEAVAAMVESIENVGLLNPITVDEKGNLICGLHRVHAHRKLGLKTIEATVLDLDALGLRLARIDENLIRRVGTALERAEMLQERKVIYEEMHPEAKQGGDRKSKAKSVRVDRAESFAADTAKKTGTTDRSVQLYVQAAGIDAEAKKALRDTPAADNLTDLVKLSRLGPEQQREVAKQIKESGETVKAATKAIQRRQQDAQVRTYRPPEGQFNVITIDLSWPYRDALNGNDQMRGAPPYPPMTVEEIVEFIRGPLKNCCDETACLLGSWITGPISLDLTIAPVVQREIEALGFRPLHERIWEKEEKSGKDFTGLGRGVRWNAEKLQLYVRGKVVINEMGANHGRPLQSTVFRAPIGDHSEKPQRAYDDLEQLVPYTSRLEMFARADRKGWVTTGAELKRKPARAAEVA